MFDGGVFFGDGALVPVCGGGAVLEVIQVLEILDRRDSSSTVLVLRISEAILVHGTLVVIVLARFLVLTHYSLSLKLEFVHVRVSLGFLLGVDSESFRLGCEPPHFFHVFCVDIFFLV